MTKFNCIKSNLYCLYCNNNTNNNNEEMCNYCYDDMSLKFECKLCKTHYYYYNYSSNPTVCYKYINSINLIKKLLKRYIFRKKINLYYNIILYDYYNPKSQSLLHKVKSFDKIYNNPKLLYIDSKIKLKTLIFK